MINSVLVKFTVPKGKDPVAELSKLEGLARKYHHVDTGYTFEVQAPKAKKPVKKAKKGGKK